VAEQQQQQQQQEQIVTPFAQILHTLHNVHKNYMQLTNVNSNRWRSYSDRVWTVASLGLVSSAAATDGVAPIFFLKKNWRAFLVHRRLQSDDFFSLSDLVCSLFFLNLIQVSPTGGCHPGPSALPFAPLVNWGHWLWGRSSAYSAGGTQPNKT